jgi:NAD(P)-dependent dehydrogenase (short-subunit alcohol dehydrogenase family)
MSILITGATSGLGLATARAVRARGVGVVALGRDARAVAGVAERLGCEPFVLDLARLADVRAAVDRLPYVDAVVGNAGVQVLRGPTWTPDGIEETFAVNHLAHLALVDALLRRDPPPRRVVLLGSATHDPARPTFTPDPIEDGDLASLAHPGPDTEPPQTAGVRRYATSKLLAVATAAALAREHPTVRITAFDPGLMPGTGLARQYPPVVRVLWSTVLKALRVLPFASSPAASGRALAALVCDEPSPVASGHCVDHRLRRVRPSDRARDPAYQERVLHESRALLAALSRPDGPGRAA